MEEIKEVRKRLPSWVQARCEIRGFGKELERIEVIDMNFRGHLIGSIIMFSVVFVIIFNISEHIPILQLDMSHFLLYLLVFVYFGLMPDLDTDSIIENYTYGFVLIVILTLLTFEKCYYAAIIGAISCIPKITHHREQKFPLCLSGMHQPLTGLVISGVVGYYFGLVYGIFAMCGFLTHLMLDLPIFKK